jgi:S1-C subfamily serine protease
VRLPTPIAAKLDGQETGLLVMSVEQGTPAEAGGMVIGDIVVAVGGAPVASTEDLQDQLGGEHVGAATGVTVLRGGEPVALTVTIGERSETPRPGQRGGWGRRRGR